MLTVAAWEKRSDRHQMLSEGAVPELFFCAPFVPSRSAHFCTYLDTFDSTVSSNAILSWSRAISLAFVSQFIDKKNAVVSQPRQELPDTQSQNSLPSSTTSSVTCVKTTLSLLLNTLLSWRCIGKLSYSLLNKQRVDAMSVKSKSPTNYQPLISRRSQVTENLLGLLKCYRWF